MGSAELVLFQSDQVGTRRNVRFIRHDSTHPKKMSPTWRVELWKLEKLLQPSWSEHLFYCCGFWELGLSSTLETILNSDEQLDKEAACTSGSRCSSVGGGS